MKKCKSCQTEIDSKAKKCPHCQADQRNWFVKHKILTGILVIILIVIISNASGNKNGGTNTTQGSNSKTTQTESIGKIGEAVTANDLSFTVTDISKAKSLGNSYTKKDAQGTFNVVTLTIKNVGKETATIDSSMLKITDSQGRTFDRSIDGQTAKGLAQGKVDLFLQQVQPSLSVTGDIVFDLPDDATDLKLIVKGSMFGTEKQISLTK
jgi:RNA polymerase subunit RPABC4/transcription elongation factor Spt4